MKIQNTFIQGRMNKDLDERLIPQGEYRDALNVRVVNSSGSDVGALENALSNEQKSNIDFGANAVCLGAVSDDEAQKVYWFVLSDTGSYISRYNQKTDTADIILSDTRDPQDVDYPEDNVLNFDKAHLIQANILTDVDSDKKFLYFTDGYNPPRRINIDTALSFEANGFTEDDVNVIVKPPIYPPIITPLSTSLEGQANYLEDKFLHFAYRYKYVDGEVSAVSPFSEVTFYPKHFNYSFIEGINRSMQNSVKSLTVEFNTGPSVVKEIDILFKESQSQNIYLAKTINKASEKYADYAEKTIEFDNSSIYKVLPEDEISRLFDNVPLKAKTQDIISNRLVYGNYEEGYDLEDKDGKKIVVDLTTSIESNFVREGSAAKTLKSNMGYEVGIVYLDEYGRSSTVLTSDKNTSNIPYSKSVESNSLKVEIKNEAPKWAKHFRFFVKQTHENDYFVTSPVLIYQDDENYYIRLEGDDKNKIENHDELIIKRDAKGLKESIIKTKILEKGFKERNFLQARDYSGNLSEESGYYIKISNLGAILEEVTLTRYYDKDEDNSRNSLENNFTGESTTYIEGPYSYSRVGTDATITVSGTYTGSKDRRYEIEIQDYQSGVAQFQWRSYEISYRQSGSSSFYSYDKGTFQASAPVSTSPTSLDNGLSIAFSSVSEPKIGDKFRFTANTDFTQFTDNDENRAYLCLEATPANTTSNPDQENITAGSQIKFLYDEYRGKSGNRDKTTLDLNFISNGLYENIGEWWHEEGRSLFIDELSNQGISFESHPFFRATFRRGQRVASPGSFTITGNSSDSMFFITRSYVKQGGTLDTGSRVYAEGQLNTAVRESNSFVMLETSATKSNNDVFYEVPYTYDIDSCGYHLGQADDQSQDASKSAIITLPHHNAWRWGNGYESYKIKDLFISEAYTAKTRPLTFIENYKKNKRTASITYSDVYEQTTNYNGLNEFNLAKINYVDLDDEYGDIERVHSRDTDLIVFQENKVSKLLYNKSVIYNADGSGNVSQTLSVFGQQVPYIGEYGISTTPHSFATWGSRIYFADDRRGAILRLSQNGIEEISMNGMRDWFRDRLNPKFMNTVLGAYDPFTGQYVVTIKDPVEEWKEDAYECEGLDCGLEGFIKKITTTTTTSTTTTTTQPPAGTTLDCTLASFTMANGTEGDSTVGQGTVTGGTIDSISPSTYQSGTTAYTATITVGAGYDNAGAQITCDADATGTEACTLDCNSGWQQLYESNTTVGSYADQVVCASMPLQVTLLYDVLGRPNRFTVYEGASIVYNSGWVGLANYAGPWGQSLSTSTTGNANITFTTTVGRKIVIERGGASSANESDAVQFNLQCNHSCKEYTISNTGNPLDDDSYTYLDCNGATVSSNLVYGSGTITVCAQSFSHEGTALTVTNTQVACTGAPTTTAAPYYYLAVRQCSDWDGDGALTDRYVRSTTDIRNWTHVSIPRYYGDTGAIYEAYGNQSQSSMEASYASPPSGSDTSIDLDTYAGPKGFTVAQLQKTSC